MLNEEIELRKGVKGHAPNEWSWKRRMRHRRHNQRWRQIQQWWGRRNCGRGPISKVGRRVWAQGTSPIDGAESCREVKDKSSDCVFVRSVSVESWAEKSPVMQSTACASLSGPICITPVRSGGKGNWCKYANAHKAGCASVVQSVVYDPGVSCLTSFQETVKG